MDAPADAPAPVVGVPLIGLLCTLVDYFYSEATGVSGLVGKLSVVQQTVLGRLDQHDLKLDSISKTTTENEAALKLLVMQARRDAPGASARP